MTFATDKVDLGYLPVYEEIAKEWDSGETRKRRVLEVGVAAGGGMAMFGELFYADVYGVDINPDAGNPDNQEWIVTCSQDDPGLPLVLESNGWGPFDLIVDDASHLAGPTAVTLANLWRLVAPGGFYVIEDWNYFEGPGLASNLWQKLIGRFLAFPGVGFQNETHPYSGVLSDVESVTIRDGMIIVRKRG